VRTLVWYRGKELRLHDHAPLHDAVAAGDEIVTLFVLDPYFFDGARARELPHRMQFLLESLQALEEAIAARGGRLFVVRGRAVEVVPSLAARWRVDRVVCQRWSEPFGRERDRRIGVALATSGIRFELTDGETLAPPASLRTGAGTPYTVFTPFSRAFAKQIAVAAPLPAPRRLPPPPPGVTADTVVVPSLESLGIAPNARILAGGEAAGRARLEAFLDGPAERYDDDRNRMDRAGTSRLSVDLKFGTVSPRTVWRAVADAVPAGSSWRRAFLNELVWREFTHATLWDRPDVLTHAFRREMEHFPYIDNDDGWEAWVAGKTGYPVVDAAARQLLGEGFVHNRARMIAASFLTKHLLIDWRRGYAHYLKWLTDGDWAQNSAGWQWSAGCGCDAQPWFRIFNPVAQGESFDPDGTYVRTWVPELGRMPSRFIHRPWEAPGDVLRAAGVVLGATYPRPVVDHAVARGRFLSVAKKFLERVAPEAKELRAR